jgi:hypothetical protein
MLRRMFNLSEFVKALKQRFAQWYNAKHGRAGHFWEARFRSVIVEDAGRALRMMSAYIDLNPVRAKVVEDPADYRWSGYAEAMAGKQRAQEGLAVVTGETVSPSAGSEGAEEGRVRRLRALIRYRGILAVCGRTLAWSDGELKRHGLTEAMAAALASESVAGLRADLLRCRLRQFSAGVIIGSRECVNEWFGRNRGWFGGASAERRRTGARRIGKGPRWTGLHCVREMNR